MYEELYTDLNVPAGSAASRRWKSLRDRYQKLHKSYEKQHRSGASGNVKKPAWPLFDIIASVLGTKRTYSTYVLLMLFSVSFFAWRFSYGAK